MFCRFPSFILASGSSIRCRILKDAGLDFVSLPSSHEEPRPDPDEPASDYVLRAAQAKARAVATTRPAQIVVGCDQVVQFEDKILTKVKTLAQAKSRLITLSGREHHLVNGLVVIRDDLLIGEHLEIVSITLRTLYPDTIEQYLDQEDTRSSVACYFIEGAGIQLIQSLDGSHLSALGLPLLALMDILETVDGAVRADAVDP